MRMTVRQLQTWLAHIEVIKASEALEAGTVAALPHMDQENRQEIVGGWQEIVDPGSSSEIGGSETGGIERISFEDFRTQIKQGVV